MAFKWTTVSPGIRCRDHESRKHGVRPDRYFTVRFSHDGRQVEEGLGWASEGWTLEKARAQLAALKEAKKTGQGAPTLREQRAAAVETKKRDKRVAEEEARRNVSLATYWTDTYEPWARATKPKAVRQEECQWRCWIEPNLGTIPINEIGMDQWDHLVKTMSAAGLSQRTREYATGTLRRVLKHARERRVISETPPSGKMVGATTPKDNRRTRTLDDDEMQALLTTLKARDIHAWRVTLFAAGTGCRAGEAFQLTWGALDLEAESATFPKTKNGNARTVPLGKEIATMLRGIKAGKSTEHVFLNQSGAPYKMAPSPFRDVVTDLKLNEGRGERDRFSFHSLRHMAATRLARVLPLRGLMDVMGWTVAAMALRYSHTAQADMKVAAEALDAALRPATGKKVTPMRTKRGGA